MPLARILGRACLESELVAHRNLAQHALALVLALDVEFGPVHSPDEAIREIQAIFGAGVRGEVIVRLVLVQILARGDDVVTRVVLLQ